MTTQRQQFEQWYACNAFNYERDPIGSRNCGLQWDAWKAAQAHMIDAAALTKCNQIIHTQKMAIEAMQANESVLKDFQDRDFEARGKLAGALKCWHRLTGEEAAELAAFVNQLNQSWSDLYGKEHQERGKERDEMNHLYNIALEDLAKHRELLVHYLSVIDLLCL